MARADRNTYTSVIPEYYSDFLITFERNPVTGLLKKISNEDAIKQSVILTVLTTLGERFYQPHFGSKIETSLFDLADATTSELIKSTIEISLKNFEPRALVRDVSVHPTYPVDDTHAYTVIVQFECINLPGQMFEVEIDLKRLR